jgi:hypothetical protein
MKKNGVLKWMEDRANEGTDQNVMPEGTGEFGYDVTNPIPTNMINDSISYLERLYTNEGVKIEYERLGSTLSPNIKGVIDVYLIFVHGEEMARLHICPYNKKTSEKAPKGFYLIPIIRQNLN